MSSLIPIIDRSNLGMVKLIKLNAASRSLSFVSKKGHYQSRHAMPCVHYPRSPRPPFLQRFEVSIFLSAFMITYSHNNIFEDS